MNTKILMMSSALVMAVAGVAFQFFPQEILRRSGGENVPGAALLIQLSGALFLGFAMMNWMAKTVLIGGIYARPLAAGNFLHFMVGALALIKYAYALPGSAATGAVWAAAAIYSLFAALFGYVFFTHPLGKGAAGEK